MSEWWSYRLSDLLMFAPRTYYRLFELYNTALWPGQLAALAAGAAVLGLVRSRAVQAGRIAAGLLAVAWLWVAWGYFHLRYATIHWAGEAIAAGFALQGLGLLLAALGVGSVPPLEHARFPRWAGRALLGLAVGGYPLLAPLLGRPWAQAEWFGVAPDPTAIATLGAVIALPLRPWLLPVPLLWLAYSAATLWTMGGAEALVVLGAALLAIAGSIFHAVRGSR